MSSEQSITLVGFPNSGKTTLFNWLTGFKSRVVNYPGSTVRLSTGPLLKKYGLNAEVTDTPGIYSLFAGSADERATGEFLFSKADVTVLVLDAVKLEIQLPLLFQLREAGFRVITVLTMSDLLKAPPDVKTLSRLIKVPVVAVQGLTGKGVYELVSAIQNLPEKTDRRTVKSLSPWSLKKRQKALKESRRVARLSQKTGGESDIFLSEKFDRFFLHPRWGMLWFGAVMFALFSSLFWLADPFMSAVDGFFGFLIDKMWAFSPSRLMDFFAGGIVTALGAGLVFVPQIFILFVGISLLEDTGYLSRAVALADGPFSRMGLSGKAFVPFLSGYACAVPAVLSARALPSQRERWMVWFSVPFMSCSARLPVYTLLLGVLFYGQAAWKPGLALTAVYIGSLFLGLLSCFFLNKILRTEPHKKPFIVDLPLYRPPQLLKILQNAYRQTKHYIRKAVPAIFLFSLLLWTATRFPGQWDLPPGERIRQSYSAMVGQWIEPFFEAMGMDWRVGVCLIAAFAAREVFVSALALLFAVTAKEGAPLTGSLLEHISTAVNSHGEMIFTPAGIMGLIVFFMVSLQCLSTTAVVYQESRSLRLALLQLISLNVLAYALAVLTYQGLRLVS